MPLTKLLFEPEPNPVHNRGVRSTQTLGCSMSVLTEYEKTVVHLLASRVLTREQVDAVIREATLVEYEYTGCGYFLTITHPCLPMARSVCNTPKLSGSADGIFSGFIIFIENGHLTIECHSWGDVDVPEWFRERNVQVAAI